MHLVLPILFTSVLYQPGSPLTWLQSIDFNLVNCMGEKDFSVMLSLNDLESWLFLYSVPL